MKKIVLISVCVLSLLCSMHAQKITPINKQKGINADKSQMHVAPQYQQANTNILLVPDIKVYEKPNYQGQSANFVKDKNGKITVPFSLKNVSVKVPDGIIVYIKTCFEFPSENSYTNSISSINLETICGIRTDEVAKITISFNGISTEIHTQDCHRFSGHIDIKVIEISPESEAIQSLRPYEINHRHLHYTPIDKFTFSPFFFPDLVEEYNRYVFDNNPVPQLTQRVLLTANHVDDYSNWDFNDFKVGKKALAEGRVKIWVKTDLNCAHKTCNTCDDFSSHVKMAAPVYESVPLNKTYGDGKIVNATHKYIVVGPYTAFGKRDGFAITASSGTYKNFRVHLGVEGL